jgi:hypothetical protein
VTTIVRTGRPTSALVGSSDEHPAKSKIGATVKKTEYVEFANSMSNTAVATLKHLGHLRIGAFMIGVSRTISRTAEQEISRECQLNHRRPQFQLPAISRPPRRPLRSAPNLR